MAYNQNRHEPLALPVPDNALVKDDDTTAAAAPGERIELPTNGLQSSYSYPYIGGADWASIVTDRNMEFRSPYRAP
jgi:hypothetical protein